MKQRTLIFSIFAAALLFAMIREWNVPAACPRTALPSAARISSR
jgi:hypothetical protein